MRAASLFLTSASLPLMIALAACSATGGNNGFETGGGGTGNGAGQGGDIGLGGGFGNGGTHGGDCSEAAKLIYVLSDANDLYSFQPDQKAFKKIGPLGCQTAMQPNSMAVDREANAWVNYVQSDPLGGGDTAGTVFKVSTANASCQPTSIALDFGWYRLGMGFSADVADGAAETLFVTGTGDPLGGASPGLGSIDFNANNVKPIGQFTGSLSGQNAELTGTGDARLFGFFTTTPVRVAELDKGSGAILSNKALNGVETPSAWAFSFWGGDFYLYTAPDPTLEPSRTTNVTRYRPSDGSIDTAYMTNIGFRIVGAGVSTCAPIAPPK